MGEVSSTAVRLLLDAVEGTGVSAGSLVAGLPLSLDEPRDPSSRVSWDVFVDFLARLDAECADRIPLEEIGARLVRVPAFEPLRRAGQLLVDPRQLYELARRFVAPALFPHVTVTVQWTASGRLVVQGALPQGYRESVPFFRVCHGNIAALPRLLDLPPSQIEEQSITGTRGRLVLRLPSSHTLAARVRRGGRALLALSEVIRGVERQQTELEASLDALRTSRHEMQVLIERLPDGVMVQSGGVVLWANAALAGILGAERPEELVGRDVTSFVPSEDREALLLAMRRAATNEVNDTGPEYRVVRPDGAVRRVQAGTAQLVVFEGRQARMVVLRDVTEQHRLRERAAVADRMAALGTLAAGVAHEINNPLAYTRLSLQIAQREIVKHKGAATPELETALERARDGTERVLGIVRHLRSFSRVQDEPAEPIDLPELVDATLMLAESAIVAKAALVKSYGLAPIARAQRGKLGQVVLNLLTNAVDAIPEGAPANHVVRVSTRTDPSGRPIIEVHDSGSGIAPGVAAQIFEPFLTTKPAGAGTGLGLAMSRQIMAEIGGTLDFESEPGATTFRVTLAPWHEGAHAPQATAPSPPRAPVEAKKTRRGRVLVVDDEPALLVSIRKLLADRHDVVTAEGTREALAIVEGDQGFDVVLTDLMMAGATGIDLYEAVLRRHPTLAPRFLFMTGGALTTATRDFLARASIRHLEKPFGIDELRGAVDAIAARRS